jgi:hypothetical protein
MEFLGWLEGNAVAVWVRESVSLWAYPTQIAIHALGLALVVGLSTMIALRLLGVAPTIPIPPLRRLFPVIWIAFAVNLFSGTLMTFAYAERLLTHPIFLTKLAGLIVGVILMACIQVWAFAGEGFDTEHEQVSDRSKMAAMAMIVAWLVTIVAGRMTAYDSLLAETF